MGWAAGGDLASDVYDLVRDFIPEDKRKEISNQIISLFEDEDADCWDSNSQIEADAGRAEEVDEDDE